MRRESREISELILEQYVLDELPPGERRRVEDALREDGSVRERLAALERSNREILSAHPPERMVPRLKRRLESSPAHAPLAPSRYSATLDGEGRAPAAPSAAAALGRSPAAVPRRVGWRKAPKAPPLLMFVLPAAAVLAVFLSVYAIRDRVSALAQAQGQETRLKTGNTHLSVFRKTKDGAERLSDGSAVKRTDVLQISYFAAEAKYGTIFSVDGRGTMTFHLPEGYGGKARTSPLLEGSGEIVLPSAYELDDAPGFERFFFAFSRAPFDVQDVARAAGPLSANPRTADRAILRLPAGIESFSLTVRKQR